MEPELLLVWLPHLEWQLLQEWQPVVVPPPQGRARMRPVCEVAHRGEWRIHPMVLQGERTLEAQCVPVVEWPVDLDLLEEILHQAALKTR